MIPARVRWIGALALLAGTGAWFALGGARAARPDILLVVWSGGRADRLSAYGYAKDTTPWLRSFASEAVLFREAFTPCPWTAPARATLFTGLLPLQHGLRQGAGDRLAPGIPLLAETLRDAGYETVGFSADDLVGPGSGLQAGFDRMVPLSVDDSGGGRADRVLESVEAWLRERRNAPNGARKPLFLFVNFMDMHLPRRPPPEDLAAMAGTPAIAPPLERALRVDPLDAVGHLLGVKKVDDEAVAAMGTVYDASARFLDRSTGRLVDLLRKDALRADAVIAVVSDHGDHLGEHGHLGHEMSLFEDALRIPMVIRWPGKFEGGRVETAQVRLQDLYPTLLEAARVPVPAKTGMDAIPLTESPLRPRLLRATFHRPTAFLAEAKVAFPGAPAEAFRPFLVSIFGIREPAAPGARGPLKFMLYAHREGDAPPVTQRELLYDLGGDPDEREDLVERGRKGDLEDAARLRAMIIR